MAPSTLTESVWDYPRPPRLEPSAQRIRVIFAGRTIVDTRHSYRLLETSHPPVYYVPPDSLVAEARLIPSTRRTHCEFKGAARYWTLTSTGGEVDVRSVDAAWCYPAPLPPYEAIAHYFAFYPSRVDACYVGDDLVQAQPGDFYGGWITPGIVGPFKGGPGSYGW